MAIKHIWFDFSDTIARTNAEEHSRLKYATYAAVVNKPLDDKLKQEFDEQYEKHHHGVSGIFYSLGKPAGWWSEQVASVDPVRLFVLAEGDIPEMLQQIRQFIPISVFSNINVNKVLPALGIDTGWFAHIISSGMVSKPKPALDGFYKIIELSKLAPNEILYIGDHVTKDIVPAKKVGLQAGLMWGQSDEADYAFGTFRDILELVKSLEAIR
jgi:HAD superfamily hydrolase (TIGR01549 family)